MCTTQYSLLLAVSACRVPPQPTSLHAMDLVFSHPTLRSIVAITRSRILLTGAACRNFESRRTPNPPKPDHPSSASKNAPSLIFEVAVQGGRPSSSACCKALDILVETTLFGERSSGGLAIATGVRRRYPDLTTQEPYACSVETESVKSSRYCGRGVAPAAE